MRVILLVEATAAAVRPSEVGPGREPELIDRCLHRFPLGTTDSAAAAVGERLEITEIATLDRGHFHAVRPRHAGGFDPLP
jgi:predicted nucleic acid-binding protein